MAHVPCICLLLFAGMAIVFCSNPDRKGTESVTEGHKQDVKQDVLPSEEKLYQGTEAVTKGHKQDVKQDVLPSEEKLSQGTESVTEGHKQKVKQDVLPSEEKLSQGTESVTEGHKQDMKQDVLPSEEKLSKGAEAVTEGHKPDVKQDVLPSEEKLSQGTEAVTEGHKQDVIQHVLQLEKRLSGDKLFEAAKQRLLQIYREHIRPLGEAYHFSDLNRDAISEGEMLAKPMILFLGPWSSGKTTTINYLLNIESSVNRLHTGAEPTTSDFTVVTHGPSARIIKGIQLVSDKSKHYAPLQKFGLNFLERFQGMELPNKLLEHVTFVDTPGIIENRKQQQRGYPFREVCQWFIDRAHLIFLMFDPSKLDIGSELEELFRQVKGHEAKVRLILNKADTVAPQELMRVYGALFWSLAPVVNEVEPPRVYVGSMWSKPYRPGSMHSLFREEEISLLRDIHDVIHYQQEFKIAATRRHAFLVRLHALAVNHYSTAFQDNKHWVMGDNDKLWQNILSNPDRFSVLSQLLQESDISKHDLPTPEVYQNFFSMHKLSSFKPLSYYCFFWSGCAMDHLLKAINVELPNLLQDLRSGHVPSGHCSKDSKDCSLSQN